MNQLLAFCRLLESRGWQKIKTDSKVFITYKKIFIKNQIFTLEIPIFLSSPDIFDQIQLCLNKACKLEKNIEQDITVKELKKYFYHFKNHFTKNKNEWIILEPDSKYAENEIPSMYIP